MLLLGVFPWLLLVILQQQVPLTCGVRDTVPSRVQRSRSKGGAVGWGKFPSSSMQCIWSAKDVNDKVKLVVTCQDPQARIQGGVTDLTCEYNAKPQSCPGYLSDPKGFWKQVGRAFTKLQRKVCRDKRALVKAGMCKRAPRDSHFRLDIGSSVSSSQSGGDADVSITQPPVPRQTSARPTNCTQRADHRKTAEEYCSSSWASICTFFLSMLQSDDC